jgi:hypothetical protein
MSSSSNRLKKFDWNAICDRCGFKFKASKLQKEWDNLYVCRQCYEERHPQDFLKAVKDPQKVPIVRPDPPDYFVD